MSNKVNPISCDIEQGVDASPEASQNDEMDQDEYAFSPTKEQAFTMLKALGVETVTLQSDGEMVSMAVDPIHDDTEWLEDVQDCCYAFLQRFEGTMTIDVVNEKETLELA